MGERGVTEPGWPRWLRRGQPRTGLQLQ